MAQPVNPPDGWTVTSGTWGVDFQRDALVYLTSGTSLKIVGTSAQTQTLIGPWFPVDGNGVGYVVTSVLQSTNNTSLLTLKLDVYQGDQTTLGTTVYLYNNAVVPTASTWVTASKELATISGYAWARFVITRASGQTASINLDRLEVKKLGPRWSRRKGPSTGQTVTSGVSLNVAFNTSNYASLVSTAATAVTVYRAGTYLIHFKTYVTGMIAGDAITVSLQVQDPVLGTVTWGRSDYTADASGSVWISHVALYRHAGSNGIGSPIGVWIDYTGAGTPVINSLPSSPFNTEFTAFTSFTGVWLGLG